MSGEHWYVTENDYPYAGTTRPLPDRSARATCPSFDELPDEAGAELWALKRELKERLDPPATATVERSGDMRYNGGSVAHLHVHFVALDAEPAQTVTFRVSARCEGRWSSSMAITSGILGAGVNFEDRLVGSLDALAERVANLKGLGRGSCSRPGRST